MHVAEFSVRRWQFTLVLFAGVALLGVASLLAGEVVHPDAVLIPLAVGLVPAAAGALFLLASRAMRRGTAGRWTAQWGALLVPLTLAAFVWLSLQ